MESRSSWHTKILRESREERRESKRASEGETFHSFTAVFLLLLRHRAAWFHICQRNDRAATLPFVMVRVACRRPRSPRRHRHTRHARAHAGKFWQTALRGGASRKFRREEEARRGKRSTLYILLAFWCLRHLDHLGGRNSAKTPPPPLKTLNEADTNWSSLAPLGYEL